MVRIKQKRLEYMIDVDLKKFWQDDEEAHRENCFWEKAPQAAMGIRMSDECVFAELDEDGDPWGKTPRERRMELNKRYNEKALEIVGKKLLKEDYPEEDEIFPRIKRIGEVFGGTYNWGHKTGEWLESDINTPQKLEKILDNIDKLDLREFMLPDNWESEKRRIYEKYGKRSPLMQGIRGPVTLAMSIYGTENLIFLYYDALELYKRFSETILRVTLEMSRIMYEEAGYREDNRPKGFWFADDNCCLLTDEMYEAFGYPVLKGIFDYYSPGPSNARYQHSDSAMEHLLPILGKLNLTGCNFGPTVLVDKIRKYMPKTRIDGCLDPLVFMENDTKEIISQVKRDCEMIKEAGTKGLNVMTAGSINNGSSLESMRAVMHAIQKYGRY